MKPVMMGFEVHMPDGQISLKWDITIPEGKYMTITHVSGRLRLPPPQVVNVFIETVAFLIPGGTTNGFHYFPAIAQQDGTVVLGQITNIPTMGAWMSLYIDRSDWSGTLDGRVTIVGQLLEPSE